MGLSLTRMGALPVAAHQNAGETDGSDDPGNCGERVVPYGFGRPRGASGGCIGEKGALVARVVGDAMCGDACNLAGFTGELAQMLACEVAGFGRGSDGGRHTWGAFMARVFGNPTCRDVGQISGFVGEPFEMLPREMARFERAAPQPPGKLASLIFPEAGEPRHGNLRLAAQRPGNAESSAPLQPPRT